MYALIQNNSFVRWVNLATDYPDTSFPADPSQSDLPQDVFIVVQDQPPPCGRFQVLERDTAPSLKQDGLWHFGYTVRDMTPQEKESYTVDQGNVVRARRDELLLQSDWTQLPDSPADKPAWATYRQQLREITSQPGFPLDIVWPVAPQ